MATYPNWLRRRLEVAPALSALGAQAASLPTPMTATTSASPGGAAALAVRAGAPATAAASNSGRAAAAASRTTAGDRLPAWARNIGLPAAFQLPQAFRGSQVYQPANLPGGTIL